MGWILLAALAALVVWGISLYNRLVALRNGGESAWSDIDVQLKRRWELIPNLVETVKSLFAVAEAYPELRANENFLGLQRDLSGLEEAIQNARRYYNAVVRDLNTAIESFPGNLLAGPFGFSQREYFELDSAAERSAPKVSFS